MASLKETEAFWNENPVGISNVGAYKTLYDYFRGFDNTRERPDCEPYEFSNFIHGYENSKGLKVLDYGCGNAYVLSQYAKHGAEVYGVDITETAIRLSKERFALMGLQGTFIKNDGQHILCEDNTFDIACSMGVLHHFEKPERVVDELYRVLKPDGKIIVMLYNKYSFRNMVTFPHQKYFGTTKYRGKPLQQIRNMSNGDNCPLTLVYSKSEAKKLLHLFHRHTFYINKLGTSELAFYNKLISPIFKRIIHPILINFLARHIGWNMYCIAYKPNVQPHFILTTKQPEEENP